jgi:hypothetical protein
MIYKFPKKFADKSLGDFVARVYKKVKEESKDVYRFDLSELEYIGNQELLVFTGILKTFIDLNIDFEIQFFKKGVSIDNISDRVKKQIIQLWHNWKIWKIVPKDTYGKYFGVDGKTIDQIQKRLNYFPRSFEIYDRYGVTPFVSLEAVNNYSALQIRKQISSIYILNDATADILTINKCHHPFTSESLSTIITEELYYNFLDHGHPCSFSQSIQGSAFMSISLHSMLDPKKHSSREIQSIKEVNFNTECLPETRGFFYDSKQQLYYNRPFLQFSFLDFGPGIPTTLRAAFLAKFGNNNVENIDNEILKFAFEYDSSRHSIETEDEEGIFIPRGLFDAFTIVKRYSGLMVVRSNEGKIIFDLATNESKVVPFSGNEFFPGTLITIYIPAIDNTKSIDISAIKPAIEFLPVKAKDWRYLSLAFLITQSQLDKGKLYNELLTKVRQEFTRHPHSSLIFLSFRTYDQVDPRLIKKLLFILLCDYSINHRNNVVIIDPPSSNIIEEITNEVVELNDAVKNYKIHPLPIVTYNNDGNVSVQWLGVFDAEDVKILSQLLYEDISIAISDFKQPYNVIGHLISFDARGNLLTNFPSARALISSIEESRNQAMSDDVLALLRQFDCIRIAEKGSIFLSSGNYYQREFIDVNNLLNDKKACDWVSSNLHLLLKKCFDPRHSYFYLGMTAASSKIIRSMEAQQLISASDYKVYDNWGAFETEGLDASFAGKKKCILICDVVSTGYLTKQLDIALNGIGSELALIGVLVSCLDTNYSTSSDFVQKYGHRVFALHSRPIRKYSRAEVEQELISGKVVRINPFTSIPVSLSIKDTNFEESVIFRSSISYRPSNASIEVHNRFLDSVDEKHLTIGFLQFNNLVHPYFFKTDQILQHLDKQILSEAFSKIANTNISTEAVRLFYPRKSGAEKLNFDTLRTVLDNHLIEEIELERVNTVEGWRFPHNIGYLSAKILNKTCLILDDGSCSGDSLIQMVDEIAFYQAKEIIVFCFVGRVHDHKREFFSRLRTIKASGETAIPIAIYFASHWHIPTYYTDENPNRKELLWLKRVIDLPNTPQSIKRIAVNVTKEIQTKGSTHFTDYKYLPRIRGSHAIPKKELLLVREEVGKVISYRLYRESFKFFDYLMKKYLDKRKTEHRYKEIELLCATFLFEPYLYSKMANILPDVAEKIEEFVRVLIFGDERIYEALTYAWNKKDILHLFFIVFRNEKLVTELTIDNFKALIHFTKRVDSTVNYVLYKLLPYLPLDTSQFKEMKYDNSIRNLINHLKDIEDPDVSTKEIRKYFNFIASLPSRTDFESQLDVLKQNYNRLKEREYHDEKISFNHNISEFIVTVREMITDLENGGIVNYDKLNVARSCWFKILEFTTPIMTFAETFPEFLRPYTYFELSQKVDSLRRNSGIIDELVISEKEASLDVGKLRTIQKLVRKIQADFELNSLFHNVIENPRADFHEFLKELKLEISKVRLLKADLNTLYDKKGLMRIPQLYANKLLLYELATNIRKYAAAGEVATMMTCVEKESGAVEITIINEIADDSFKESKGEGLRCIGDLASSKLFGFTYSFRKEENQFIQQMEITLV